MVIMTWYYTLPQILRSEVDFFVRNRTAEDHLHEQESRGFYPPRIQIFLASTPKDPTLTDAKIKFKGAESSLHYDIFLDLPDREPVRSLPSAGKLINTIMEKIMRYLPSSSF